jgi:uncharacterized membrane protein YbjE (DUF340 family)
MYKKKEKKLEYTKRKMRLMTYIYIIGLINGFNTDTKLNCTEIHNTTFLFFFFLISLSLNNTNTQKIRKNYLFNYFVFVF